MGQPADFVITRACADTLHIGRSLSMLRGARSKSREVSPEGSVSALTHYR
jgi:hypothetical protein